MLKVGLAKSDKANPTQPWTPCMLWTGVLPTTNKLPVGVGEMCGIVIGGILGGVQLHKCQAMKQNKKKE